MTVLCRPAACFPSVQASRYDPALLLCQAQWERSGMPDRFVGRRSAFQNPKERGWGWIALKEREKISNPVPRPARGQSTIDATSRTRHGASEKKSLCVHEGERREVKEQKSSGPSPRRRRQSSGRRGLDKSDCSSQSMDDGWVRSERREIF